jgi:Arc/MetJ-type ribon-helix-helix transcriptional regulator
MEGHTGAIAQVHLTDELKAIMDRQIAAGLAESEADYLEEAVRRYAEDLDGEDDIEAITRAGIADAEAGRYTLVETEADAEALHQRAMARVRASLAKNPAYGPNRKALGLGQPIISEAGTGDSKHDRMNYSATAVAANLPCYGSSWEIVVL